MIWWWNCGTPYLIMPSWRDDRESQWSGSEFCWLSLILLEGLTKIPLAGTSFNRGFACPRTTSTLSIAGGRKGDKDSHAHISVTSTANGLGSQCDSSLQTWAHSNRHEEYTLCSEKGTPGTHACLTSRMFSGRCWIHIAGIPNSFIGCILLEELEVIPKKAGLLYRSWRLERPSPVTHFNFTTGPGHLFFCSWTTASLDFLLVYKQLVTGNRVGIKWCLHSKVEDSEAEESGTEEKWDGGKWSFWRL